jgi:hypothetical protein
MDGQVNRWTACASRQHVLWSLSGAGPFCRASPGRRRRRGPARATADFRERAAIFDHTLFGVPFPFTTPLGHNGIREYRPSARFECRARQHAICGYLFARVAWAAEIRRCDLSRRRGGEARSRQPPQRSSRQQGRSDASVSFTPPDRSGKGGDELDNPVRD